jgi:hypothetical protein
VGCRHFHCVSSCICYARCYQFQSFIGVDDIFTVPHLPGPCFCCSIYTFWSVELPAAFPDSTTVCDAIPVLGFCVSTLPPKIEDGIRRCGNGLILAVSFHCTIIIYICMYDSDSESCTWTSSQSANINSSHVGQLLGPKFRSSRVGKFLHSTIYQLCQSRRIFTSLSPRHPQFQTRFRSDYL